MAIFVSLFLIFGLEQAKGHYSAVEPEVLRPESAFDTVDLIPAVPIQSYEPALVRFSLPKYIEP